MVALPVGTWFRAVRRPCLLSKSDLGIVPLANFKLNSFCSTRTLRYEYVRSSYLLISYLKVGTREC